MWSRKAAPECLLGKVTTAFAIACPGQHSRCNLLAALKEEVPQKPRLAKAACHLPKLPHLARPRFRMSACKGSCD